MSDDNNDDTTGVILNAMAWTGLALLLDSDSDKPKQPAVTQVKPAGQTYRPRTPYKPPRNITPQFNAAVKPVKPWAEVGMAQSIRNRTDEDLKNPSALEWKKALEVVLLGTPENASKDGMKLTVPSAQRQTVGFKPASENAYTPAQLAAVENAYKEVREGAAGFGLTRPVIRRINTIALEYKGPEQKAVFDFGKAVVLPLMNGYSQTVLSTMGEASYKEMDGTLNEYGDITQKRIQKLEARERELQPPDQNTPAPKGPAVKGSAPG